MKEMIEGQTEGRRQTASDRMPWEICLAGEREI